MTDEAPRAALSWAAVAGIVASVDLQRRLRTRSALIQAVLAPLALAVVFGTLISGATVGDTVIGVAGDGTPVAGAIVASFADVETDAISFAVLGGDADVGAMVAGETSDGEESAIDAAIAVHDDGGGSILLRVYRSPEAPVAGQIAEAIANDIAARFEAEGGTGSVGTPVTTASLPVGGRQLSALPYYGASMSLLLGFFSVSLVARSLLEERDNRTLDRLQAASAPLSAIAAGKAASLATVTAGGFVVVWLLTWGVFGGEWGSPIGVVAMIVASVIAIGGIGVLAGSFARTPRQADTSAAVISFVLAILGGSFVPPADTPAALRALRTINPIGWALDGFAALSADAAGVSSVAVPLGLLLLTGAVAGTVGLRRLSRPGVLSR